MKEKLEKYGEVQEQVSLKEYNTFHVGGVCKYMIFPDSIQQVQKLISFLKQEKEKYFILGNGSNIIFSDGLYDGVIISLKKFQKLEIQDGILVAGAGVMMPRLAMEVIQAGYSGFEWAVGIPGTVGGCIFGNAEAYKESTFDFLNTVTVLNLENEIEVLKKENLTYAYRTSFFKEHPGFVILEATFSLKSGNKEESMERIVKRREKRMSTQPLEFPSAGSVFRNPSIENPSGKIIEELGLKGLQVGGAQVSRKHANFIINTGNATSNDIKNLIELVHTKVKQELGIDLVMEQEYVGWD